MMHHKLLKGISMASVVLSMFLFAGCQSQTKQSAHPRQLNYAQKNDALEQKRIIKLDGNVAKSVGGFGSNTTGGAKATAKHTYIVKNAKQLHTALRKNLGNQPRKIIVSGYINMAEDQYGNKLNQLSYIKRAKHSNYNSADYLHAFNPHANPVARKNRRSLELSRKRVAKIQLHHIRLNIPSNTTIIGTKDSKVAGTEFNVDHNNVILRNLHMEAPRDEFPKWSVSQHKWIPKYNAITIHEAKNIWIDHDSLTDEPVLKSVIKHFNKLYIQYGNLINVDKDSTNMTISNNTFAKHDNIIRIGKHNSRNFKSNVTIAHNNFLDTRSHMPFVSNANVDLLNNEYVNSNKKPYEFYDAWKLGENSHVYASGNIFNIHKISQQAQKSIMISDPNQYFTNVGTKIDNANANPLDKQKARKYHLKQQNSFNHKINNIQNSFGANLG